MDLEKIKQRVSRKAAEEQQTINKGLQKELTWVLEAKEVAALEELYGIHIN